MHFIETQSKTTVTNWSIDYARINMLPIFEKAYRVTFDMNTSSPLLRNVLKWRSHSERSLWRTNSIELKLTGTVSPIEMTKENLLGCPQISKTDVEF